MSLEETTSTNLVNVVSSRLNYLVVRCITPVPLYMSMVLHKTARPYNKWLFATPSFPRRFAPSNVPSRTNRHTPVRGVAVGIGDVFIYFTMRRKYCFLPFWTMM